MIKGVKFVINCTVKGFEYLSFMLVKGIYFYLYLIVSFFKKIFKKSNSVEKMYNFIQQKPRSAESSLLVVFAFVVVLAICDLLFFNVNEVVVLDKEINVEELKLKDENYEEKYDVVAPEIEESKNYDKSLFKYYCRAYRKIKKVRDAKDVKAFNAGRKAIYQSYTHLGVGRNPREHGNFLTYAYKADKIFSQSEVLNCEIRNQVKRHWCKIENKLKE